MGDIEQEINLDDITDERVLQNLLDQTEDIDDRKAIRARIQELKAVDKATPPGTPTGSISGIKSSDLVEDALRSRQRAAEDRKKRMMAAYDAAARSAQAGVVREVNFEAFKKVDVSDYNPNFKTESSATFGSSGGVAKVTKAPSSQPGTPLSPGFPGGINFPKESEPDAMEKMIRARQVEADERKQRILASYDIVAKQGAGPKLVCLEEFKNIDVKNHRIGTSYSSSAGFTGGVPRA